MPIICSHFGIKVCSSLTKTVRSIHFHPHLNQNCQKIGFYSYLLKASMTPR